MHSAIFTGLVRHTRLQPKRHAFRYRTYMLYLDLDELPSVFAGRWLWSVERANLCSFRRADYLGPAGIALQEAVRDRVHERLGRRPAGAVRMLTHVRTLGYVFNPVTFYYCFDRADRLEAVAAEITNTPWGERHVYVLDARTAETGQRIHQRFRKEFHVSPFQGMELEYDWVFSPPGERLSVSMRNLDGDRATFEAGLECVRRPLTAANLAWVLARHPLHTFVVHAAIYWQAARLWFKRMPFHAHPSKRDEAREAHTT